MAFVETFDPTDFFRGQTLGLGVVRSRFGKIMRRCEIVTEGRAEPLYDALHFDETYTYDDGSPTDVMHWAVSAAPGGLLQAAEPTVLGEVRSKLQGPAWRVRFFRHLTPPSTGPTVLYDVRFCQVSEDVVMKQVTLSLMQMRVATLHAFHRRVS